MLLRSGLGRVLWLVPGSFFVAIDKTHQFFIVASPRAVLFSGKVLPSLKISLGRLGAVDLEF